MTIRQCKACPWKVSTVPDKDIPNGYTKGKHCALEATIAKTPESSMGKTLNIMACHHSGEKGTEFACAGWLHNQLGAGNNIGLRLAAMRDPKLADYKLVGPQHERFEDTLPS